MFELYVLSCLPFGLLDFYPQPAFFEIFSFAQVIPSFQLLRPKTSEPSLFSFLHTSHSVCEGSLSVYLLHPYLPGESHYPLALGLFQYPSNWSLLPTTVYTQPSSQSDPVCQKISLFYPKASSGPQLSQSKSLTRTVTS